MKFKKILPYIIEVNKFYGCFLFEPLEIGQGITLGNALRRTLLSELTGYGITNIKINNIKHEFNVIEYLKEDILEIILNLKEIIFKNQTFQNTIKSKAFLIGNESGIITANKFCFLNKNLVILNPTQYICTLVNCLNFYLELIIERGKGYKLKEENLNLDSNLISLDTNFNPIKKANYKVKLIYDKYGKIKESLIFDLYTNGSISPQRSLNESLKILIELFSSFLYF